MDDRVREYAPVLLLFARAHPDVRTMRMLEPVERTSAKANFTHSLSRTNVLMSLKSQGPEMPEMLYII